VGPRVHPPSSPTLDREVAEPLAALLDVLEHYDETVGSPTTLTAVNLA
jgi:hypothetical protein